jgi:hypothetical protein
MLGDKAIEIEAPLY